jgi:hypothetical protein
MDIQLVNTKYIGYSELDGVKGYCFYNMVTQKVSFSRNVVFDENVIIAKYGTWFCHNTTINNTIIIGSSSK